MNFSANADIDAPIERVFDRLTDFKAHQALLGQRGVSVKRIDGLDHTGVGTTWAAKVKFRGKNRHINVELTEVSSCERVGTHVSGNGLAADCVVSLTALSPEKTGIAITADIKHRNLTGRLLIQSMRIIKPRLDARFQTRLNDALRHLSGA